MKSKTARKSMVKVRGEETELTAEYAIKTIRDQRRDKLFVNRMDMLDMLLHAYDTAIAAVDSLSDKVVEKEDALELASRVRLDIESENEIMRSELATIRATAVAPPRVIMAMYPGEEQSRQSFEAYEACAPVPTQATEEDVVRP